VPLLMLESWGAAPAARPGVWALEATEHGRFPAAIALLAVWGLRCMPGKAALPWPAHSPGSARLEAERCGSLRDEAVAK
jgi:hypothetical protein